MHTLRKHKMSTKLIIIGDETVRFLTTVFLCLYFREEDELTSYKVVT